MTIGVPNVELPFVDGSQRITRWWFMFLLQLLNGVNTLAWQPSGYWHVPDSFPNNEVFALPTKTGYTMPAGMSGSILEFEVAPTNDWTGTFYAGATVIGSVLVHAGTTTGIFTFLSAYSFTGELFKFIAPVIQDPAARGLAFLFNGTRTQ